MGRLKRHYTTVEQSKKLLELGLSPESADLQYPMLHHAAIDGGGQSLSDYPSINIGSTSEDVPCWSVGALEDIIYKNNCEVSLLITHGNKYWMSSGELPPYDTGDHDTIIDACFEMVVWLLENNNLKAEE